VARNLATLVSAPKAPRAEIQPFTPEQARRFLVAIEGDRLEALYSVTLAVGLREGEAFGLRWTDVDLDTGTLTVRHSLQRIDGALVFVEPKTPRSRRTIALPAVAIRALQQHQARQAEERLAAGRRWAEHNLVFSTPIGTPLDRSNVLKAFRKILRQAGLRRLRFHHLRHTRATLLPAQGVHPRLVIDIPEHSQINLTPDTYSHVIPVMRQEVAAKMDETLSLLAVSLAVKPLGSEPS
jgi:integrase